MNPPPARPPLFSEITPIPHRPGFGTPCPDGGYALHLARRRLPQWDLMAGERVDDVLAAVSVLAIKRASRLGRAPVIHDVDAAAAILGYDAGAPDGLVRWRTRTVTGIRLRYAERRALADRVPDRFLLAPLSAIRAERTDWRALVGLEPA
ncbi:MAG: hypothetical protein KDB37_04590 [Ilumatobacter sp.]|nr:hypothetical protein [Ilumatobacter sp.]